MTVLDMLNLCEKKENIKSIISCVKKLISTSNPKSEYEIPYNERKVRNRRGGRFPTIDIDILTV